MRTLPALLLGDPVSFLLTLFSQKCPERVTLVACPPLCRLGSPCGDVHTVVAACPASLARPKPCPRTSAGGSWERAPLSSAPGMRT